ncbi:hypothetical protein FRB97_006770 [Tulasnella sp. 331]|nr:hypothetical protein FRB97_006770 [Tulasnella sp. 331]
MNPLKKILLLTGALKPSYLAPLSIIVHLVIMNTENSCQFSCPHRNTERYLPKTLTHKAERPSKTTNKENFAVQEEALALAPIISITNTSPHIQTRSHHPTHGKEASWFASTATGIRSATTRQDVLAYQTATTHLSGIEGSCTTPNESTYSTRIVVSSSKTSQGSVADVAVRAPTPLNATVPCVDLSACGVMAAALPSIKPVLPWWSASLALDYVDITPFEYPAPILSATIFTETSAELEVGMIGTDKGKELPEEKGSLGQGVSRYDSDLIADVTNRPPTLADSTEDPVAITSSPTSIVYVDDCTGGRIARGRTKHQKALRSSKDQAWWCKPSVQAVRPVAETTPGDSSKGAAVVCDPTEATAELQVIARALGVHVALGDQTPEPRAPYTTQDVSSQEYILWSSSCATAIEGTQKHNASPAIGEFAYHDGLVTSRGAIESSQPSPLTLSHDHPAPTKMPSNVGGVYTILSRIRAFLRGKKKLVTATGPSECQRMVQEWRTLRE